GTLKAKFLVRNLFILGNKPDRHQPRDVSKNPFQGGPVHAQSAVRAPIALPIFSRHHVLPVDDQFYFLDRVPGDGQENAVAKIQRTFWNKSYIFLVHTIDRRFILPLDVLKGLARVEPSEAHLREQWGLALRTFLSEQPDFEGFVAQAVFFHLRANVG